MSAAKHLVDTNVLLVAETPETHVSGACRARCQRWLADFVRGGHLVLDDGFRILKEYGHELRHHVRQPGLGRAFYKWAHQNQMNPRRCTRVGITPVGGSADGNDFEEFPDHPGLAGFDRSDRKFVATSAAHAAPHPAIVQASDSKWIGWADALGEVGIDVEFLCEEELTATWEKKQK